MTINWIARVTLHIPDQGAQTIRYYGRNSNVWRGKAAKRQSQRDSGFSEIKGEPLLGNIEKDPGYRPFLQKMKLPT